MSASSRQLLASPQGKQNVLQTLRPVLWPMILFSCLINILIGTGPLFMLQIFDRVLPTGDVSTLLVFMLLALFALSVMALLEYVRGTMMTRAAAWWERDMTRKLLPVAASGTHTATQISTSISRVSAFLAGAPLQAIIDAPWAILFFGLAYLVHPTIALVGIVVAVALILLAVFGHLLGRATTQLALSSRLQASGMVGHLDQNRKLLSTMGMATNLFGLQQTFMAESHVHQQRSSEADQARRAAARFLRMALQILVLGTGAWLVLKGELSGGAMIASSILLARALAPVEQLTGSLAALVEVRIAYRDLSKIAAASDANSRRNMHCSFEHQISCENVAVIGTPGAPPILQQITTRFAKGMCVAVMGDSGAGKTTLIELLAGARTPTQGTIRLDGSNLQHLPSQQRAQLIGYLPQNPTLFPGTIAENIARFQSDADDDEILRAATAAGVHGMISGLPDGYETRVSFNSPILSGGESQRIAMARALYGSPKILVLDEPNAALDKDGERALISTLAHLKQTGVTIIMVAHRAGVLGVADRVLLLDSGRVRDSGSKAEVFARMNVRVMQIDLERRPDEASRLEDWITSHFKRDSDDEARSTAAIVATEMFNVSLASNTAQNATQPVRFMLRHRRGTCTISMLDTCDLIATKRIEKLRRIAEDEMLLAPALEGPDLALLMIIQLAENLEQKPADHGRVIEASIATPIREDEAPADVRLVN